MIYLAGTIIYHVVSVTSFNYFLNLQDKEIQTNVIAF